MMLNTGTKGRSDDGTKWTRSTGFTFTEVMFAVILLGVGFIMVAAIFPVAIQQSQSNLEDAAGITVVKQGAAIMSKMGPVLRQARVPATTPPIYDYNVTVDNPAARVSAPL